MNKKTLLVIFLIMLSIGSVHAERITSIYSKPMNMLNIGISTGDLGSGVTQEDLVNSLLGGGVTVSNIKFKGVNVSAGIFSGGAGIIGFDSGIILSTGDIANVKGPNNLDGITAINGVTGDIDLDALIPNYKTTDATVLEFDFVPVTNQLQFKYVFSSDEYNEFVDSTFNDVYGFYVNGNNIALIPGTTTPVSINNVNCGYPYDGANSCAKGKNSNYFINNDLQDGGGSINTEMDGLTTVLTATANVNAGQTNHIKLAIADAGDSNLDSNVFIEAGSFKSPQLKLEPSSATNPIGTLHTLTATLLDSSGSPISGQIINFAITNGPNADKQFGNGVTDSKGVATWSYTSDLTGTDTIVATGYDHTSIEVYKTWEQSSQLKLTPLSSTNLIGDSHLLTATLINGTGVPVSGQTITFSVIAGPHNGTYGTGTTDNNGNATWSYKGISVGTDTIVATGYDLTSNEVQKTWQQSALSIVLDPATATNQIGAKHTVTATVKNSQGDPQSLITVEFSINSGPNSPLNYSGVTDTNGQATFTYTGDKGVGIDTIQASISANGDSILSNTVEKEWLNGDILAYYRGLNIYPDVVETKDLLKGGDDWRDNIVPPGFSASLTTNQLLQLADEWRTS